MDRFKPTSTQKNSPLTELKSSLSAKGAVRLVNILTQIILVFPSITMASYTFDYALAINETGYQLTIKMLFPKGATLSQVRNNFRSPYLLSEFNPNIKSVTYNPVDTPDYQMQMYTKSWGIGSWLLSECHENDSFGELWNRQCQLDMERADGNKYMHWKRDASFCALQRPSQDVLCRLDISGRAKAIRFLGFDVVTERNFTLKAKESAIKHFLLLWLYGSYGSYSTSQTKDIYETLGFRDEIEDSFKKALNSGAGNQASVKGVFHLPNEALKE